MQSHRHHTNPISMPMPTRPAAPPPPAGCPASCDQAPGCHCGSTSPPSGLSPSQVPQFIVLTNDDSGAQRERLWAKQGQGGQEAAVRPLPAGKAGSGEQRRWHSQHPAKSAPSS